MRGGEVADRRQQRAIVLAAMRPRRGGDSEATAIARRFAAEVSDVTLHSAGLPAAGRAPWSGDFARSSPPFPGLRLGLGDTSRVSRRHRTRHPIPSTHVTCLQRSERSLGAVGDVT